MHFCSHLRVGTAVAAGSGFIAHWRGDAGRMGSVTPSPVMPPEFVTLILSGKFFRASGAF
jgi:hypothetical protein